MMTELVSAMFAAVAVAIGTVEIVVMVIRGML